MKTKFEDTFDLLLEYKDKKVSDFLIKKEREGDKSYEYYSNLILLREQGNSLLILVEELLYLLSIKLLICQKEEIVNHIKVLDDKFSNEKNKIGNYEIDYKRYPSVEDEDVKKPIDFFRTNRIFRQKKLIAFNKNKTKIVIEIKNIKDKVKEIANFQFN